MITFICGFVVGLILGILIGGIFILGQIADGINRVFNRS